MQWQRYGYNRSENGVIRRYKHGIHNTNWSRLRTAYCLERWTELRRYTAGRAIDAARLRHIWRLTTIVSWNVERAQMLIRHRQFRWKSLKDWRSEWIDMLNNPVMLGT